MFVTSIGARAVQSHACTSIGPMGQDAETHCWAIVALLPESMQRIFYQAFESGAEFALLEIIELLSKVKL